MFGTAQPILVERVGVGTLGVCLFHDSERADTATDLIQIVLGVFELLGLLPHQDKGAEFGLVVGQVDAVVFAVFEEGMRP